MGNFDLNIGQSEFEEQRTLLERLVGLLQVGQPATIEPDQLDALVGLQNLCDAIADQQGGRQLRELIRNVVESADDTGCEDDLTVASKSAIEALAEYAP